MSPSPTGKQPVCDVQQSAVLRRAETVRVTDRAVPYNCERFEHGRTRVRKWFIVSAIGRDRPGIVADLAQLVFDCEANLEDSRMTLLGNEFAAILLCSGQGPELEQRLAKGAKASRDRRGRHRGRAFLRSRRRAWTARGSSRGSVARSRTST
jgi:predicted amino acid-binding ACT domain protein